MLSAAALHLFGVWCVTTLCKSMQGLNCMALLLSFAEEDAEKEEEEDEAEHLTRELLS